MERIGVKSKHSNNTLGEPVFILTQLKAGLPPKTRIIELACARIGTKFRRYELRKVKDSRKRVWTTVLVATIVLIIIVAVVGITSIKCTLLLVWRWSLRKRCARNLHSYSKLATELGCNETNKLESICRMNRQDTIRQAKTKRSSTSHLLSRVE